MAPPPPLDLNYTPPPPTPLPPASVLAWGALVGRGLRPYRLWLAFVLAPLVAANVLLELPAAVVWVACVWTVPWDSVCEVVAALGKLRECLADCIPLLPGLVPYFPQVIPPIVMNIHRIAPFIGDLAPFLKYLLPYPEFVAKALPKLLTRIEIMGPMIGKFGPQFAKFDKRHFDKLELVLDDMVLKAHLMIPHVDLLAPHLPEIALRADKLMPIVHYILPYAETMGDHIEWLIPYADVENFEEFMPMLDKLAAHIDEFAPFGRILLPHALNPKVRKHVPILIENIDTVLPNLGQTIDYLDPLVYWMSDLLPIANSLGLLRSRLLLKVGAPFARFLPSVPNQEHGQAAGDLLGPGEEGTAEWWRMHEAERSVKLSKTRVINGKTFYELQIDGRYAGEFRYSSLFGLHQTLESVLPDKRFPVFPPKFYSSPSLAMIEERRKGLERYLVFVLSDPEIVNRTEFSEWVRQKRRWSQPLPLLQSPLISDTRG